MSFINLSSSKTRENENYHTDVPPGTIQFFSGDKAPENWIFCDGSSLQKKIYSKLFSFIGTTFGAETPDSFNIPNITFQNIKAIIKYI